MRAIVFASTLLAALACVGCSSPDDTSTNTEPTAAAATRSAPAAARDVSGLKACELVPGAEVVKIAGASKLAAPLTAYPGGCMYVVQMADGAGESYQLRYDGSGLNRLLIEHFTPEENMRAIEGPWEQGFIGPQLLGGGTRFVAVRGDLSVEVTGDRAQPMVEIAKLAVSRAP